jgi:hypothetical protein
MEMIKSLADEHIAEMLEKVYLDREETIKETLLKQEQEVLPVDWPACIVS